MDSFHSCCLCDDLIEVEVGGAMSAPLPTTPSAYNVQLGGYQISNVSFSFNRTLSQLFNGINVSVSSLVLRPLVLPTDNNFRESGTSMVLLTLSNKVRLDITDSIGNVLARSVLHIIALSPAGNLRTAATQLQQEGNITTLTGYFNGHITLTGNGLLRLLPPSLTIDTPCTDLNTAFSLLYSTIIDLLKKYGNNTINHTVCDLVITIPSLLLTITDLLNNACSIKCKNKVSSKVIDIINNFKTIINNVEVPSSSSNGISFSLRFIYDINRTLATLNKILQCDLSEFLCYEPSSSECSDSSSSSSDNTPEPQHNNRCTNQLINKLTSLETAINRISQTYSDTKREFAKLQEKVSQQDKVVKKVAECVLKK